MYYVSIYSGNAAHLSPMEFKKGFFHVQYFLAKVILQMGLTVLLTAYIQCALIKFTPSLVLFLYYLSWHPLTF
jgi:hypothetical protein